MKRIGNNQFNAFHRMSRTRIYKLWVTMKGRCETPTYAAYRDYGGRGIAVCQRWSESFENFYADMGDRPEGCSLDRIDNDGPYSPENCRWATLKEQGCNKRNNRVVTCFGESKILADWRDDPRCAVNFYTIRTRLSRGWPDEKALTTPAHWRGQENWAPAPEKATV
jgi:hypothetical protein